MITGRKGDRAASPLWITGLSPPDSSPVAAPSQLPTAPPSPTPQHRGWGDDLTPSVGIFRSQRMGTFQSQLTRRRSRSAPHRCLFAAGADIPMAGQSPRIVSGGLGMVPGAPPRILPVPFGVAVVAAGDGLNGRGPGLVSRPDPEPHQESICRHVSPPSSASQFWMSRPLFTPSARSARPHRPARRWAGFQTTPARPNTLATARYDIH